MKCDLETTIDRDPAIRGVGKYRIMKDSKGSKPPKGIIPLSVADTEFRTASYVIDAVKARADLGMLDYHHLTDSFRGLCCQWTKIRHGWDAQPDWIIPPEQVVPALYNVVWTFTQPGDGILTQILDYHHFAGTIVNTGRKVLENHLVTGEKGHYAVDFDNFYGKARRAKLFFLCSPQGPTGRVWTEEELRRMGGVCNGYNVMVMVDEIHHDLVQFGCKHIVYASLDKEFVDNCIIHTSLSKTFNLANLCYVSIITSNDEVQVKFQKQMGLQALIYIERSDPMTHEATYHHSAKWLEELIQVIRGNYEYVHDFFAQHFPGVVITKLEDVYLVWCDFCCFDMSGADTKVFLIGECMLYLDSGTNFGAAGSDCRRIDVACPRKTLADALNHFYQIAKKHGMTQ